jgi:WW domain
MSQENTSSDLVVIGKECRSDDVISAAGVPASADRISVAPAASQAHWLMFKDPATGAPYYYAQATGQTVWERPCDLDGTPAHVIDATVLYGTQAQQQQQQSQQQQSLQQQIQQQQQQQQQPAPSVHQAATATPFIVQESAEVSKLSSILDRISGSSSDSAATVNWRKCMHPTSRRAYYCNEQTGISQWEQPDDYIDLQAVLSSSTTTRSSSGTTARANYAQGANFNVRTGRFDSQLGTGDHWSRTGKAADRETRQLSHYFDVSTLDQNRRDAAEQKRLRAASAQTSNAVAAAARKKAKVK